MRYRSLGAHSATLPSPTHPYPVKIFPFWFFHTLFPLYLSYFMQKKKKSFTFSLHLTKIRNTSKIWGKSPTELQQKRKNFKDSIHKMNGKIKQNQTDLQIQAMGAGETYSELLNFCNETNRVNKAYMNFLELESSWPSLPSSAWGAEIPSETTDTTRTADIFQEKEGIFCSIPFTCPILMRSAISRLPSSSEVKAKS